VGNRSRKLELVHDAEPVRLGELIHDAVRVAIERIVREELEEELGAAAYERAAVRHGYRNGTRHRTLAGPTGPLALTVPRATLFAPGGEVSGMLTLYHRRERIYSDGEVRLAQAFTDQSAVALHNADLAEKEREAQTAAKLRLERLRAVAQITEQLLTTTDLDSVLHVVVEAAARLSNAGGAMIGLVAVVVATVILVFFGIGYALGRLFL